LELGFEGASVDVIAKRAGVSKATLYHHFADKTVVFRAFLEAECAEQARRMFDADESPPSLEARLRAFARSYVRFLGSPFAQGIYRLAVGESARFPDIGRIFWQSGPDLGVRRLEAIVRNSVAAGQLATPDPRLAAHQLMELCKVDLFPRVLFGLGPPPTDAECDRIADAAVDLWLAGHRPPPPSSPHQPSG
jgi:TetR/AcrR family transcriptional repressor of mexJK operon